MRYTRSIVFPEYYHSETEPYSGFAEILRSQIATIMPSEAESITCEVVSQLPELKRLVYTDVEAVLHNDPAVTDKGEVILCYPLTMVMLHYRLAHILYRLGVKRIPRMLTEMAHSRTGIDIHPAAQIGAYFCIDHGTGVVIGATAIISSSVLKSSSSNWKSSPSSSNSTDFKRTSRSRFFICFIKDTFILLPTK